MDQQSQQQNQQQSPTVASIPVNSQNDALQLMVYFINVAYKRNAYSLDEAAKIYECVKMFVPEQPK